MHPTDEGFYPLFQRLAAQSPERTFARFPERTLTTSELLALSGNLSAWMGAQGVGPGDRVALMLSNSPLSLALLFAIARSGAVWVPVNTRSVGANLAYILGHCEPALIICDDGLEDVIGACGAETGDVRIVTAPEAQTGMDRPEDEPLDSVPQADAPFAIMYTSGTTGPPKGVIVSHRMLRLSSEAIVLISAPEPGDVMYMWEPLFHIGGAQMIGLPLIRDVTLVFAERFSASRFWSEVRDAGASHIHFLGGILQILLKQPPGPLDRAHGARIAWGGGCPRDIWRPFEERFGVEIRECYGMTECSSVTSANLNGTLGSVGTPLPWFSVELLGQDGAPVEAGATGEIVVATDLPGALTAGYLKNPEATAKALRDGCFHTGDIGSRDTDGNLYFHGRMSDNVRVGGENVSAYEVEHVAAQHPAVEDCAMIGVEAEVGEQDIKLFVKVTKGTELSPADLSEWLGSRLAPYQNPRYIQIVEEFERTPSQRIMKHRLSKRTDDGWVRD